MINEKNKDVICAAPWMHLYIDVLGAVKPCCTQDLQYGDANRIGVYSDTRSIIDIWNSPTTVEFRKNLLDGVKQEGCKFCYNQEKHTGVSLRTSLNAQYGNLITESVTPEMQIKYFQVSSSNLCNMACIMCGPVFSSDWYDDDKELHKDKTVLSDKFYKITKETEKDIIKNIINDELDLIYFTGGEPLITAYHYKLLDKMVSMNIANDIKLRYSTNLSTLKYKSFDLIEHWSHFKSVEVAASIDMIGERAELHRYGTDWKKISQHLHTVRFDIPNVTLCPQITVTALSVGYLPELLTYFIDELKFTDDDTIHSNLVFETVALNPQLLPTEVKQMYTKKLESFLENTKYKFLCESVIMSSVTYMNEVDKEQDFHLMTEYLNSLDRMRRTDWKSLWPEIAKLVPKNNLKIEVIDE
jgi:MoaA/NifB/PqqE/SkfB family radical SAM enzyme